MVDTGLPLALMVDLVASRTEGLSEDLTPLAMTLLVYRVAERCGLVDTADWERRVPRAMRLSALLGWTVSRHTLGWGHTQAEAYGFFSRWPGLARQHGGVEIWRAQSAAVQWRIFKARYIRRRVNWVDPALLFHLPAGQIELRSKADMRVLLLSALFDVYAVPDPRTGERLWRIQRQALLNLLGIVAQTLPDYLLAAGLVKELGRPDQGYGYVLRRIAREQAEVA